jgi:hypothetical protein
MSEVFPIVLRDPFDETNTLVVGTMAHGSAERLRRAIPGMASDLRQRAALEASRLAPRLSGGEVYTDDRAPVEWLVDRSILGYAAGH